MVARVRAGLAGGLFEVGDAPVGGGELVFEADDAGRRGQGHVLIEQRANPGGQREIGPAVAALPARGATRAQQPSGIEAAQKGGLHTEQLRGGTHRVGRVVDIVELVRGAALGRVTTKRALGAAMNQRLPGPLSGVGSPLRRRYPHGLSPRGPGEPEPGDRDAGEQRTVATGVTVRGYHLLTKEQPLTACKVNSRVRNACCLPPCFSGSFVVKGAGRT